MHKSCIVIHVGDYGNDMINVTIQLRHSQNCIIVEVMG